MVGQTLQWPQAFELRFKAFLAKGNAPSAGGMPRVAAASRGYKTAEPLYDEAGYGASGGTSERLYDDLPAESPYGDQGAGGYTDQSVYGDGDEAYGQSGYGDVQRRDYDSRGPSVVAKVQTTYGDEEDDAVYDNSGWLLARIRQIPLVSGFSCRLQLTLFIVDMHGRQRLQLGRRYQLQVASYLRQHRIGWGMYICSPAMNVLCTLVHGSTAPRY